MNRFNQKLLVCVFAVGVTISCYFGMNHENFSTLPAEINRSPAQIYWQNAPFIRYTNPRIGCTNDWASCGQANECCSSLCLQGNCVPRYFSNQKGNPGQSCNSSDQCFSGVCDSSAQKCIGSSTNVCAYVAQFCNANAQCCSGICNLSNNQCQGDSAKECGTVGASCSSSLECCSEVCDVGNRRCVGGSLNPAGYGQSCNADSQCISNVCNLQRQQCQ